MKYQILDFEGIVFNAGIMIGSQNFALESTKVVTANLVQCLIKLIVKFISNAH